MESSSNNKKKMMVTPASEVMMVRPSSISRDLRKIFEYWPLM